MFRRVREAARRGRTQAKSLLAWTGRKALVGAVYVGRGLKKVWHGIDAVLTAITRAVSWLWMSVLEVEALVQSPFTWVIGNVLFAGLRGGEALINKVFRREHYYMRDNFPSFTLLNAVAINNTALYPLIALVGWILSPLTGQDWWRSTAHGFKTRTLSAADHDYYDRFAYDLAYDKTMREETVWEAATAEQPEETLDAATYYQRQMAEGYTLVYPEDKEEGQFDYLVDRVREATGSETAVASFLFSLQEDQWGRSWAYVPEGVSTQRPPKTETVDLPEPEEHLHAKHAAEEQVIQTDPDGLMHFDINQVPDDTAALHDPKERSFWYGVEFAIQSRQQIKDFLTNTEQQNRARAMVAKDTRNPKSGFLQAYALKGFEQELERAQEAAKHSV